MLKAAYLPFPFAISPLLKLMPHVVSVALDKLRLAKLVRVVVRYNSLLALVGGSLGPTFRRSGSQETD